MKEFLKCFLIGLLFIILMICFISYIGIVIYGVVYYFQQVLIAKGFIAVAKFLVFILMSFYVVVFISIIGFYINDIREERKTI